MKKIIMTLALCLTASLGSWAQQAPDPGNWKAYDLIKKADAKRSERSSEAFAAAQQLYADAEKEIMNDMAKAEAEGKTDKLARLHFQNAQLQFKLLQDELTKAQQGIRFDTLAFCKRVDGTILSFDQAEAYNRKPNAKGKVKPNSILTSYCQIGISNVLTLYYNCGVFMDSQGDKQASVDYFQKFVDLPKATCVFSDHQADSIYERNAKTYSLARYNLALQNYSLHNWQKAIDCATEALKDTIDPQNLYIVKLNSYGELKDSVSWARTLVEAAERTGNTNFYTQLVQYYLESKKVDEANALIEKLVNEKSDKVSTWYMKGYIELDVKKDYAAARESFAKALEIDPNAQQVLRPMAMCYVNDILNQIYDKKFKYLGTDRKIVGRGRGGEADKALAKEVAIYDKELAYMREYYSKALPYLEKLRELNPDNPRLWASDLQLVYSNLGRTEEAKLMDELLDKANRQAQGLE